MQFSETRKNYFPILDALRFFASICVLLAHSVVYFGEDKFHSLMGDCKFITNAGYFGVVFFYVLSGFLITYLLLSEKDSSGTIAVRNFYMRRLLRIWPLYYLIIFLSFFLLPYLSPWKEVIGVINTPITLLLYLLFLPNIVPMFGSFHPTYFHTYTVGYEEQFYLFWPLVLKFIKRKLLPVLLIMFLLPGLLEIIHLWIIRLYPTRSHGILLFVKGALTYVNGFNLPAFIAGAIAACIIRMKRSRLVNMISLPFARYLLIAAILFLMSKGVFSNIGYVNLISIVFALLILNLVQSFNQSNVILDYACRYGKISYGIYIYHPTILIFVSFSLKYLNGLMFGSLLIEYIFYLILSFFLVLLVSSFSYRYYERFFLNKKIKYRPET